MAGLKIYGISGGVALGYALMLHWVQFFQVFVMGMYFLYKDQISFGAAIRLSRELREGLRKEKTMPSAERPAPGGADQSEADSHSRPSSSKESRR